MAKPVTPFKKAMRVGQMGIALGVMAFVLQAVGFAAVVPLVETAGGGQIAAALVTIIAIAGCTALCAALTDARPASCVALVGSGAIGLQALLHFATNGFTGGVDLTILVAAGLALLTGFVAAWWVRRRAPAKAAPKVEAEKPVWPPPPPSGPPPEAPSGGAAPT